ncbi:MAG: hypothetical protein HQ582_06690 [Planctomycetes bacterium]|nr:hypothetical protein [Planctomycetota bacterium]
MRPHLSDSEVQREVEPVCLQLVSDILKVPLAPDDIRLDDGTLFRVDGVNRTSRVLCEVFAHVGKMLDGQKKKLAKDMLKLLAVENALGGEWRKIICIVDDPARKFLEGRSWCASVIRQFRFEVLMPALDDGLWRQLKTVQGQQAEGMKQRKARPNAAAMAVRPGKVPSPYEGGP